MVASGDADVCGVKEGREGTMRRRAGQGKTGMRERGGTGVWGIRPWWQSKRDRRVWNAHVMRRGTWFSRLLAEVMVLVSGFF
jgi:hypothetical protein